MKAPKKWKDPIEEIHWVRAKLAKEMEKDPKGFRKRMREKALSSGFQVSDRKPLSMKESGAQVRRSKTGSGR